MTVIFQVEGPTITSLKDFPHEVFEGVVDVLLISEVHVHLLEGGGANQKEEKISVISEVNVVAC